MKKFQEGEIFEPILIIVGLLFLTFLFILPSGPSGSTTNLNEFGSKSAWQTGGENLNGSESANDISKTSVYKNFLSIGTGNASYEKDPVDEYVSLSNSGSNPATISGWHLTNAKEKRPFDENGQLFVYPSDKVFIPQGTTFLSPTGANLLSPIVLKGGETAIIITGSVGSRSEIPIVSFKENKCSGYLEEAADYKFTPPMEQNCPDPDDEIGVDYLDIRCQDFIGRMSRCHVPKFNTKDQYGKSCANCVDGIPGLSTSCMAFLKARFSYAGCLAYHGNDADFQRRQWRIFLGHPWELWHDRRETVSIFDQFGNLIDYRSY